MKQGLQVKNGVIIPEHELEISASRSGGPGGQHVNKTSTRITVRWNVRNTVALTDEQKERVLNNLQSRLTAEGDLIVHSSASRSQTQNKELALAALAHELRKALYVPKKRTATKIPGGVREARLKAKKERSKVKKMRNSRYDE